jgi:iron-sulfur cluster assembly accessory protein
MKESAAAENVIVNLTAAAAAEVKHLLTLPENAGKNLRVYVEQGGCSGMQYGMVFDERRDGDLIAVRDGVPVLVDAFSAKYLQGMTVDFSEALTGGGFKIANPNARQSCGCGKSFEA